MLSEFIWNIRLKGWSYVKNYAGVAAAATVVGGSAAWGVLSTRHALGTVVAARALDRERAGAPEYLYFSDPAHELNAQHSLDTSWTLWPYVSRWVRRGRRALWRRLLHVCRYGDPSDRLRAMRHLTSLHHLKDWEKAWLSQRLEARTAVLLAREGPTAAELLRAPPLPVQKWGPLAPLSALATARPTHTCLASFIKYRSGSSEDIQRLMEHEVSGGSGDVGGGLGSEEDALLQSLLAVLHHLEQTPNSNGDQAGVQVFAAAGGLVLVQQAARSTERPLRIAAAQILQHCSAHADLLPLLHRTGLLEILSTWFSSDDAELSCMAAGTLAGLESGPGRLYCGALHLLHPLRRPPTTPRLDLVTVHGLLGEPFVTWRQRDRDGKQPEPPQEDDHHDTRLSGSEEDIHEVAEGFEIVLRDLPESSLRDSPETVLSHRDVKRFNSESEELKERTRCWPRDWLPRDCPNIRVLGVSYATVMTDWGSGCPGAEAEAASGLEARAQQLGAALRRAGVGLRPTVWLAHSMGGLLVKQILVQSLESEIESERALALNTWGVIFYSTPHHGSRAAHALLWPSREVQDLREDCAALGRLHKRWLAGAWRCVCIGEGRATPLVSLPGLAPALHLVPPKSADAGRGPFYTLPLDHLEICKPASRDSFIYRMVVEMIQHAKGEMCKPEGCSNCEEATRRSAGGAWPGPWLHNLKLKVFQQFVHLRDMLAALTKHHTDQTDNITETQKQKKVDF